MCQAFFVIFLDFFKLWGEQLQNILKKDWYIYHLNHDGGIVKRPVLIQGKNFNAVQQDKDTHAFIVDYVTQYNAVRDQALPILRDNILNLFSINQHVPVHPLITQLQTIAKSDDQNKWQLFLAVCENNKHIKNAPEMSLLCRAIAEYDDNLTWCSSIRTLEQLMIAQQKREAIDHYFNDELVRLKEKSSYRKISAYQCLINEIKKSDPNTTLSEIIRTDSKIMKMRARSAYDKERPFYGMPGWGIAYASIQDVLNDNNNGIFQATSKINLDKFRNELAHSNPYAVLSVLGCWQSNETKDLKPLIEALKNIETDHHISLEKLIQDIIFIENTPQISNDQIHSRIINRLKDAVTVAKKAYEDAFFSKNKQQIFLYDLALVLRNYEYSLEKKPILDDQDEESFLESTDIVDQFEGVLTIQEEEEIERIKKAITKQFLQYFPNKFKYQDYDSLIKEIKPGDNLLGEKKYFGRTYEVDLMYRAFVNLATYLKNYANNKNVHPNIENLEELLIYQQKIDMVKVCEGGKPKHTESQGIISGSFSDAISNLQNVIYQSYRHKDDVLNVLDTNKDTDFIRTLRVKGANASFFKPTPFYFKMCGLSRPTDFLKEMKKTHSSVKV